MRVPRPWPATAWSTSGAPCGRSCARCTPGEGVAFLIDQNVQEKDGIFVDFFGRPAATTTVAAALAVKTGCALVPGHTAIGPDGRYRAVYDPPLEWTPSGDKQADIARLTQDLTRVIEGWMREQPRAVAVDPSPVEDAAVGPVAEHGPSPRPVRPARILSTGAE